MGKRSNIAHFLVEVFLYYDNNLGPDFEDANLYDLAYCLDFSKTPIVVCGAAGVGKSTVIRKLITPLICPEQRKSHAVDAYGLFDHMANDPQSPDPYRYDLSLSQSHRLPTKAESINPTPKNGVITRMLRGSGLPKIRVVELESKQMDSLPADLKKGLFIICVTPHTIKDQALIEKLKNFAEGVRTLFCVTHAEELTEPDLKRLGMFDYYILLSNNAQDMKNQVISGDLLTIFGMRVLAREIARRLVWANEPYIARIMADIESVLPLAVSLIEQCAIPTMPVLSQQPPEVTMANTNMARELFDKIKFPESGRFLANFEYSRDQFVFTHFLSLNRGTFPFFQMCVNDYNADLRKTQALHSMCLLNCPIGVAFILNTPEGPELVNRPDREGTYPIHLVTWDSQDKVQDLLLAAGVEIDVLDKEEYTALHYAAETHGLVFARKIKELPAFKSLVNMRNSMASTPLCRAATNSDFQMVMFLLECGASVQLEGVSPVDLAARSLSTGEMIKSLLLAVPDLEVRKELAENAMFSAIEVNSVGHVKTLASSGGVDVESLEARTRIVHVACLHGSLDVLKYMESQIPTPVFRKLFNTEVPFHIIGGFGSRQEAIMLEVDGGEAKEMTLDPWRSCFLVAVVKQDQLLFEYILSQGVDLFAECNRQCLHHSVIAPPLFRSLIQHAEKEGFLQELLAINDIQDECIYFPTIRSARMEPALELLRLKVRMPSHLLIPFVVCFRENPFFAYAMDLLISQLTQVDLNWTTPEGNSILHVMTLYDEVAILKLLLAHGGDSKARNKRQESLLHLAAFHDSAKTFSFLLFNSDIGSILDVKNLDGLTCRAVATDSCHNRILALLDEFKGL